ncbi:MAG: glycosyltransferase family 39 protein [Candidatus Shapirobacteria bacterium]
MSTTALNRLLITILVLISVLVRFWSIGTYPALNPDEAALGYNAYSLLLTGRDEHGAVWPLHFKSFSDYKPGGYVYLDLPIIAVFGLNTLVVRLPNLFLSLVGLFFFYRLLILLTKNFSFAYMATLLLSLSPWHIHFSRGAWESGSALSLIIIGTYFFYSYLNTRHLSRLLLFVLMFASSLYLYHSARIVSPLLAISYFLINIKSLVKFPKHLIISLVFGLFLVTPVLVSFVNSGGAARFGGVGFTADPGPRSRSEELLNHHVTTLSLTDRVLHNYRLEYGLAWLDHYLSHFNFNFLFLVGDEVPRSKVPQVGQLLLITLPLFILGLFKLTSFPKLFPLIICWLLVSPLAASLTFQSPSALRALPLVVPLTLITTLGVYTLFELKSKLIIIPLFLLFIFNFIYYVDAYFRHYQQRYPFSWNMGTKELVSYLKPQISQYQNVYITNVYDQPYILYLFFSQYPPSQLQPKIQLTPPDKFGFSTVDQLDNITFHVPPWDQIPPGSLVVAAPSELSNLQPQKTISYQSYPPTFKIYIK